MKWEELSKSERKAMKWLDDADSDFVPSERCLMGLEAKGLVFISMTNWVDLTDAGREMLKASESLGYPEKEIPKEI